MKFLIKNAILGLFICTLLGNVFAEAKSKKTEPLPEKLVFEEVKAKIPLHKSKFKLQVPSEFNRQTPKLIRVSNDKIIIDLYAINFAQGELLYAEFYLPKDNTSVLKIVNASIENVKLTVAEKEWGYRAFYPVDVNAKTGIRTLFVKYTLEKENFSLAAEFQISITDFPVFERQIDLGKFSDTTFHQRPENQKLIASSTAKKREAFASNNSDLLNFEFSHPRDVIRVTSAFGAKRRYINYRIVDGKRVNAPGRERIHYGLDLAGPADAPVFAIATGKVVASKEMFYEGNMIIIDHGNRIFSLYMHMNKLKVKEGDIVNAGTVIGLVGSTGLSTGAHLHVGLLVNGIYVNPLSFLSLPVR